MTTADAGMDPKELWPLPPDLDELHIALMNFAFNVNSKIAKRQDTRPSSPLAYKALQRLHRLAISTHRGVRSLCEAGWTPLTPVLLRTMLDVLVSVYAIGKEPADAEFMGFRYMAHGLIEGMVDKNAQPEHQAINALQVAWLKSCLPVADVTRANAKIADYYDVKVPSYWYSPELPAPGVIIFQRMNRIHDLWKGFCGSTHGSDIGAVLFADDPNNLSIVPEEHPRRTRDAIVASSRILLDISHARAQCEDVANDAAYKHIVGTYIRPQQGRS
jgi:hypothetical protein